MTLILRSFQNGSCGLRLQIRSFPCGKLKAEIFRETFGVSFYRLVENLRRYVIKFRQIRIQNHLLVPQVQYQGMNRFLRLHKLAVKQPWGVGAGADDLSAGVINSFSRSVNGMSRLFCHEPRG